MNGHNTPPPSEETNPAGPLQSLIAPLGLTLLLLLANGTVRFTGLPDSALIQFGTYLWIGIVLFLWIRKNVAGYLNKNFANPSFKDIMLALGCGIGLFIAGGIGYAVSQALGFTQPEAATALAESEDLFSLAVYAVTTILAAPLLEEIAFRGIILQKLNTDFGKAGACCISALLFSVYHLSAFQLLSTFLMGIGLAWLVLRKKENNLWVPVIAHGVYNGIGFLFFMLAGNAG